MGVKLTVPGGTKVELEDTALLLMWSQTPGHCQSWLYPAHEVVKRLSGAKAAAKISNWLGIEN